MTHRSTVAVWKQDLAGILAEYDEHERGADDRALLCAIDELEHGSIDDTHEFRRIVRRADALRRKPHTATWPAAVIGVMNDLEGLAARVGRRTV